MPQTTLDAPAGPLPAYLASPEGAGPWPGAVVVQEALGMSDDLRAQADRLAGAGYLAIVPDLYGRGGTRIGCMVSAFRQLGARSGAVFDDIGAARAFLAAFPDCTGRIGLVGFSLGGSLGLICAARPGFAAASINYAQVPKDAPVLLTGSCPIVASYGGRDRLFASMPGKLSEALDGAGVPHDVKVYPEAGHSFMSRGGGAAYSVIKALSSTSSRIGYHAEAAQDSWRRILAFFGEHLEKDSEPG